MVEKLKIGITLFIDYVPYSQRNGLFFLRLLYIEKRLHIILQKRKFPKIHFQRY